MTWGGMVSQNWRVSVSFECDYSEEQGHSHQLEPSVYSVQISFQVELFLDQQWLWVFSYFLPKGGVLKPVWSPVPSQPKYKEAETPPHTCAAVQTLDMLHRPRSLVPWAMSKEESMGQIVLGSKGLILAPSGLVTAFSATLSWSSEWVFD